MASVNILGISGSLRKGSFNTKLLHEAGRLFGDCTFTHADIRFPLYDGDLETESGIPESVKTFCAQVAAADAIVISTPEYNSNLSGVLKNALDWASRHEMGVWRGKPVAIMSAAAGRAGGARSIFSLRHCLTPFNPLVLQGPEILLAGAQNEFNEADQLKNEFVIKQLTALMADLKSRIS